jgi:hypothetical protein
VFYVDDRERADQAAEYLRTKEEVSHVEINYGSVEIPKETPTSYNKDEL